MERSLEVEDRAPGIRVLTLNRPRKKNALDDRLLDELEAAVELGSTAHVRAFVIRGAGGAFSAGYDVTALAPPEGDRLPDDRLGAVLRRLEAHPAPLIAAVEGPAFGAGMELACTCDLRVASEDAVFCMPPSRLGIVYAPEGLWRVARLCGLARARRMFFTGERVPAGAALEWRLVEQVAPKEEVVPIALAWAAAVAQGAPLAIQGMKRAFNLLSEPPLEAEGRSELRALRKQAFASEDAQEGQRAFKEKRPPRFKGR